MIRISVFYATTDGKKFDHDYGAPAPYVAIGHVHFNSLDGFQKGMGQHGKEIS